MYAEQFNAPTWLEEPSKWLWWAMQSRLAGNLQDSVYNLQQFWKSLDEVKQTATDATWPEILALDSQSHIQAASTTSSIINAMEQDVNLWTSVLGWFGFQAEDSQAAIAQMQNQRTQELQKAHDLAQQAQTATAQRVQAVASGRLSQDDVQRARENSTVQAIITSNSEIPDILGIPLWGWIAGAVALLVLPQIMAGRAASRARG